MKDQAPDEKERRAIMAELLSSPLDAAQIGIQASAQPVSANPKALPLGFHCAHLSLRDQKNNINET